ncbi:hypothetical protein HID58_095259 [Brassica napus]|uniref:Rab-GAP TBC domain-containing protein n=1 Tax=Brassica napus TaxID=3708 RepID=A0ABQ7X4M9_BRANA|nr:hypothetical protein HID58_095259 [Brassica napus]
MWGAPAEPADSYYQIRPECTDVPNTRFKIKPGKTLSVRKWQAAFTQEGFLDMGKTLNRIQRGGIHPTIRGEVWEFLLGCYDPKSTLKKESKSDNIAVCFLEAGMQTNVSSHRKWWFHYRTCDHREGSTILDPLVLQETNLGEDSDFFKELESRGPLDKKVIQWMLTLHQIGLDVNRTDRTLVFYEKKENLSKLWDILALYAWIDDDVGYCQGMSDLCSPMIMLLEDEADAFWCFERLMRRLNLGGGDYLFAIRMIMVQFRREFSFCDSLYLWEMMWALEYDPEMYSLYEEPEFEGEKTEGSSKGKPKSIKQCGKYERENIKNGGNSAEGPLPISVFLVASVLKDKSSKLMTEARGLDDVVKILNDITGNLDAKKACTGAMKLHKKYLKKARNSIGEDS